MFANAPCKGFVRPGPPVEACIPCLGRYIALLLGCQRNRTRSKKATVYMSGRPPEKDHGYQKKLFRNVFVYGSVEI